VNGIRVLLIDADAASRDFLSEALRQQGYEVLPAAAAKHGLLSAWSDHPAIIVADPVLPDLSGEELAARLRAHSSTAVIPLVALSSDRQPARRQSCTRAGFSAYIVKSPSAMSALTGVLKDLQPKHTTPPREGGSLIVFLSAKGGTGTSSLCANLAMSVAEQQPQARLVVVDLVLPIGSIAGIVGYEGDQNVVSSASFRRRPQRSNSCRKTCP
jgi:CheY-like chemotaxis protein